MSKRFWAIADGTSLCRIHGREYYHLYPSRAQAREMVRAQSKEIQKKIKVVPVKVTLDEVAK